MAGKNWRKFLTEADLKNWQWAYDRWVERDAREWAASPRNPSVADHMFGQGSIREPDHSRGFCSPLGGQATPAEQIKEKRG